MEFPKFKIQKKNQFISFKNLYPHEEVITERKNNLVNYILSYKEYVVIPSIIVCNKSYTIIDGHHRYYALRDIGVEKMPVTLIDYFSPKILTHKKQEYAINKNEIIEKALSRDLLSPKSTIHVISDDIQNQHPIILLSNLTSVKL